MIREHLSLYLGKKGFEKKSLMLKLTNNNACEIVLSVDTRDFWMTPPMIASVSVWSSHFSKDYIGDVIK